MTKPVIRQRHLPYLLLIIGIVSIGMICCFAGDQEASISQVKVESGDKVISISWDQLSIQFGNTVEVVIQSEAETVVRQMRPWQDSYEYRNGKHGELYQISVNVNDANGSRVTSETREALFLNWEQLPDMPLISIETRNGEVPTTEYISAPEGYLGMTLLNNDYVYAHITMYDKQTALISGTGEIRIRGNTSASGTQKPYKLKMTNPCDFLNRNDEKYCDREWVLLTDKKHFNLEIGTEVSRLCGLAWQPQYIPVNLMMNGDWLGAYYLVESVKEGQGRINIDKTGFIIEQDAYWWSEPENYFKTQYKTGKMAYTYKYPAEDQIEMRSMISDYMCAYEECVNQSPKDVEKYIDVDSFSGWLLAHDILGTGDPAGSNQYLYKYDLQIDDIYASKLKMGPTWDFDANYITSDRWALIQYQNLMHSHQLFQNDAFKNAYQSKWDGLSDTLNESIHDFMGNYTTQYPDLQQSWDLDSSRWQKPYVSVEESVTFVNNWFETRTAWLNQNIPAL